MSSYRKEPLTGQMHVYVSENHRFGTDAFLLANFSNWRKKDLVCDLGTGCGIIPMILQRKNPPNILWGWIFKPMLSTSFHRQLQNAVCKTV